MRCDNLAVEPGDWTKVCIDERIKRIPKEDRKNPEDWRTIEWSEESVACPYCDAMLMASPDDDIDPVKADQEYDKDTYHRFARPKGWKPPTQKTLDKEIEPNDPVLIKDGVVISMDGTDHDLSNAEGIVKEVKDGKATVTLSGLTGDVGQFRPEIPVEDMKVIDFETMRKGDRIFILRGRGAGKEGIFQGTKQVDGNHVVEVHLDDGTFLDTKIERIRKAKNE